MTKSFPSIAAARRAIAKTIQGVPYRVTLEAVDGSLRYVPTFRPATDEQRARLNQLKYRCDDDR